MTQNTGMIGHTFHRCPQTPNCVSTMASEKDEVHYLPPLRYQGTLEQAQHQLAQLIAGLPGYKLMKQESRYWHYVVQHRLFSFDDVEFYFPPRQHIIHMRSASEIGYADGGRNRARLEKLQQAFFKMNAESSARVGL